MLLVKALTTGPGRPGVLNAWWGLLTFPLGPGQDLPLPPQHAAQSVSQST